jgi:dTDP-4-amino-4,6-dideoxygalactose transaminase
MKIRRTIPPAAALLFLKDLGHGLVGMFSGKRSIQRLEAEVKEHFGVRHVFLVSSGKAALALTLLALKSLSPKKKVVIPAYTCFSVPAAVLKAGLELVLCDVDPSTLDFDHRLLEKAVDEETLCIVPTHLFGAPSDMVHALTLARSRGAFVVEDAAQAMGARCEGKKLGTFGDVGFFSLGRGKNITCGSGGVIVTNSDRIAGAMARCYADFKKPALWNDLKELFSIALMVFFIHPALFWFPAGFSFLGLGETRFPEDFPLERLSGMKSGILRKWKERLMDSNQARVDTASSLKRELGSKSFRENRIPYLRLPVLMKSREARDLVYHASKKQGLGISLMYPTPVNEIDKIKSEFAGQSFPAAKRVAETLLAIPTHPFVSERDRSKICELFDNGGEAGALTDKWANILDLPC